MKVYGTLKRAVLAAAFLVLGMTVPNAVAEQYLGEFCWDVTEGDAAEPTGLLKCAVYQHEGGHYTLLGTMTDYVEGVNVVNGNAELLVGQAGKPSVVINMLGSNPAGSGLMNMVLDGATLHGSYSGIVTLADDQTITSEVYSGIIKKRGSCE